MGVVDQVEGLLLRGKEKLRENHPEEAFTLFNEALSIADSDELSELATIYKADALLTLGTTDAPEIQRLPAIVMRRRSPRHLFLASYSLMFKFRSEQDFGRAEFYGRIALDAADQNEGENWRPVVLTDIGNLAVFDSRFEEAITIYETALSQIEDGPDADFRRAFIIQNIGYCKLLLGETETGILLIHQAIEAMKTSGAEGFIAESYIDLCHGYVDAGDLDSARHYGELGLALATENRQIRNAHYLLGEVCHKAADIEGATAHFGHLATYYPDFPHLTDLLLAIDLRKMVNLKLS